jgi:hypothetical protein
MARAHRTPGTGEASRSISIGWRVFQVLGLLSALSWLASYVLFASPFQWVGPLFDGTLPAWGDVVFDFSPVVSLIVILLAVAPEYLEFTGRSDALAYAVRAVVLVLPALWMLNVFVGTPMVDKLITQPLNPSRMIPTFAGVFLHVVFQHWFQAIAALGFALVPQQFGTLTGSQTPAGVQCALVNCE